MLCITSDIFTRGTCIRPSVVGFDAALNWKFKALFSKRLHTNPKFSVLRTSSLEHEYVPCFVVDTEIMQ